MPFVNFRWLGGMLTNFTTIYRRLQRLKELEAMVATGATEVLPKKEVLRLAHEREKLERNLGGIRDMTRLPAAVWVVDTRKEHIAVTEARKLGIPVVAITGGLGANVRQKAIDTGVREVYERPSEWRAYAALIESVMSRFIRTDSPPRPGRTS